MKELINKIYIFFKWIRYKELFLLLGPPFMGIQLGNQHFISEIINIQGGQIFLLLFIAYLVGAHVFLFNLWAGIKHYSQDAEWIDYPLKKQEIKENFILLLSFLILGISLILSLILNFRIFILSIIISLLWILYAHPKILLKGNILFAILIHFINGNLHFLLGYLYFSSLTIKALLISNYFSLIFVAGYFHHILKDRKTDKEMGIKTLATEYNPYLIFYIANLIFFITFLYLGGLCYFKILPRIIFIGNIPLIITLAVLFSLQLKHGIDKENIINYRKKYRLLFTLYGIYITLCNLKWH